MSKTKQETFNLRPTDEFIEMMKLLQIQGIAQTGGHAKIIIQNGEVSVNGETELRKRKKLRVGDIVVYQNIEISIAKEK